MVILWSMIRTMVYLFRGPISLVVLLCFGVAFYMMWGQIFIFGLWLCECFDLYEGFLLNYFVPHMSFVGADSLFTHDNNTCPHVAKQIFKFLEEVEIVRFANLQLIIEHYQTHLGQAEQTHLSLYFLS